MKTCARCSYTGEPVMPKVDFIEVALWLVFMPMGFFFSIFRRLECNRSICPKCGWHIMVPNG